MSLLALLLAQDCPTAEECLALGDRLVPEHALAQVHVVVQVDGADLDGTLYHWSELDLLAVALEARGPCEVVIRAPDDLPWHRVRAVAAAASKSAAVVQLRLEQGG